MIKMMKMVMMMKKRKRKRKGKNYTKKIYSEISLNCSMKKIFPVESDP